MLCSVCNLDVPQDAIEAHLLAQVHIMALLAQTHVMAQGLRAFNEALRILRSNQHCVGISGDGEGRVNFGVVDPTNPSSVETIFILLTEPRPIRLLHIQLRSTVQSNLFVHWSPFAFATWGGQLFPQTERPVILSFDSGGRLGKFQDQLQFLFRDDDLNELFIIVRDLVAVVGDEEDLSALAPIAPYVPGNNRRLHKPARKLEGIKPSPNKIEWVRELRDFSVPENILRLSDTDNLQTLASIVRETLLPGGLTSATYRQFWSTLLFLEELRLTKDLEKFNMTGEKLDDEEPYFTLSVPGLLEKRPSVLVGGKIGVHYHPQGGTEYIGYVHRIVDTKVYLYFHRTFENNRHQLHHRLYDIFFYLHRLSLRRMHQALSVEGVDDKLLFPLDHHAASLGKPSAKDVASIIPINGCVEGNGPQKLAVACIVRRPPGSIPFVVFGPPGTGKTVVMIEAMSQILRKYSKSRLLACAPSNSASDLLAQRLQQQGFTPSEMFRLNAPSRKFKTSKKVSASILYGIGMKRDHFTHIFIDEAGQALEPEVMVPIRTLAGRKTNIILSGDPKQLGPIVCSNVAAEFGCRVSYLERLMARKVYQLDPWAGKTIVKLTKNFRSHVSILQYPNEMFYNGELEACGDARDTDSLSDWDQLVTPCFPIIFHAIAGDEYCEGSSPSFFNSTEVLVVREYVQALREQIDDNSIGVITPYYAQSRKIKMVINDPRLKQSRPGTLTVGSVEVFQGQERQAIIISTVRSNVNFLTSGIRRSLGFVADPRRFNVAITRAKALLIIVGDPAVLSLDPIWRGFLDYIHASGGWRGIEKDWLDAGQYAGGNINFLQERQIGLRNAMEQLWGMA